MIVDFNIYKDLGVEDNFRETLSQVDNEILNVLVLASEELAAYIISEKLSGQVLNRRTGKLSESISAHEVERTSFQYTMAVIQDEEIAPYGPVHEFGGHVPERFASDPYSPMHWVNDGGKDIFATRARAFDMPLRSYMRSALDDQDAHIQELVAAALQRVVWEQWGS